MKMVLITYNTPSSENIRGTSALPYHLTKGSNFNDNVNHNANQFDIYTYNNNGLSDEKIRKEEKDLGGVHKG